jgi:hypothetical protein
MFIVTFPPKNFFFLPLSIRGLVKEMDASSGVRRSNECVAICDCYRLTKLTVSSKLGENGPLVIFVTNICIGVRLYLRPWRQ